MEMLGILGERAVCLSAARAHGRGSPINSPCAMAPMAPLYARGADGDMGLRGPAVEYGTQDQTSGQSSDRVGVEDESFCGNIAYLRELVL